MQLKLVDLNKRFFSLRGAVSAVREVNLEVSDGEFFVLLGPSGCGKSTLLNLIAGLERPTGGKILFDGKAAADRERRIHLPPKKRNVAFVFQNYALYPHLNVFNNIAFPLKVAGVNREEIKVSVKNTAKTLQISNLLDVKPGELSGGQRQRVAIARAIVRKPNLFLLDEPLSNLDAQLRVTMRKEMKDLQKRLGITTVYVTHDQTEAMSLGDRIAVLNDGRVEQIGTAGELYNNPGSLFVARFIGSPAMNLLDCAVEFSGEQVRLAMGGQFIELPADELERWKEKSVESVVLGIRPEHLGIAVNGNGGDLRGQVQFVEVLGRENVVHLRVGEETVKVLTERGDFKEGDDVGVEIQFDKAHFFTK
jgi:multiple sugar transport system ATP-binding protein